MGFENLMRYREQFPVTKNLIYLNHAAVAPLCRPAAEAMKWLADDALEFGSLHYDRWLDAYDGLRRAAARLVNATPEEIALMKNTSEGIATVAMGLDWRAGDRIVAFREEFPANQYPWQRLQAKGGAVITPEIGLEFRHRAMLPFLGLDQERAPLQRTEGRGLAIQRSDGAIAAYIFQDGVSVHCSTLPNA